MTPILIQQYDYELPDERIAKYPLEKRDESKLLIYRGGNITEKKFLQITDELASGSLLIYNNTKVIQARMIFHKSTGARIEIFCLEPTNPSDYTISLASQSSCVWKCMVGNLKKWKQGELEKVLTIGNNHLKLTATLLSTDANSFNIQFKWNNPDICFAEILDNAGELPIPPYLNRETEEADKTNYQTVYSKISGSVAAPTAGLHFTPEVLNELKKRNIETEELTLHVGAGTFQPVKAEDISEHQMHTEIISVRKETILKIIEHRGPIIAVGTTTVRTLESLYYIGCQILEKSEHSFQKKSLDADSQIKDNLHINSYVVEQWEPYKLKNSQPLISTEHWINNQGNNTFNNPITNSDNYKEAENQGEISMKSIKESSDKTEESSVLLTKSNSTENSIPESVVALKAIVRELEKTGQNTLHAQTRIMIRPGYKFRIIDGLITNFHQPRSTLLLLVSALIGEDWKKVYDYALKNDFRFLSYGDSSLLLPHLQ